MSEGENGSSSDTLRGKDMTMTWAPEGISTAAANSAGRGQSVKALCATGHEVVR